MEKATKTSLKLRCEHCGRIVSLYKRQGWLHMTFHNTILGTLPICPGSGKTIMVAPSEPKLPPVGIQNAGD